MVIVQSPIETESGDGIFISVAVRRKKISGIRKITRNVTMLIVFSSANSSLRFEEHVHTDQFKALSEGVIVK